MWCCDAGEGGNSLGDGKDNDCGSDELWKWENARGDFDRMEVLGAAVIRV